MSNRTMFVNKDEGRKWLQGQRARVLFKASRQVSPDTVYELPDGSIFQEHDQEGERYTLDLLALGLQSHRVS